MEIIWANDGQIDGPNDLLNVVELCCVVSGGISSGIYNCINLYMNCIFSIYVRWKESFTNILGGK